MCLAGIEGTGSYGAGLARHITAAGIRVVEVDRSDRQDRRRQGKSDPLDAVSAARAAQSGRARGAPKGRDGAVEAIRTLMVARRSAAGERTRTINQARALVLTGPDDLRARFARHKPAALITGLAALRPRPGDVAGHATRIALRELGRRAQFPAGQLVRLDELIIPLVTARAPGLLAIYGAGPRTAALLLIAAGDHPERLRSEAAWAHLCGAAPIPASSGKVTRHRLNPGGDRQANHALWRIVFTRLGSDAATRAYAERRTAEGKSKAEIIRCLKRYVAREVYRQLRLAAELGALLVAAGLGPPLEHALISLLALNGLRVSEATGADIEHLGQERGHRTLTITRKGGKVVTIPLAPRTARAIDLATGERCDGPIFLTGDGRRIDRHGAGRIVRKVARRAGITKRVCHGCPGA